MSLRLIILSFSIHTFGIWTLLLILILMDLSLILRDFQEYTNLGSDVPQTLFKVQYIQAEQIKIRIGAQFRRDTAI